MLDLDLSNFTELSSISMNAYCYDPSLVRHIWETQKKSYHQGVIFSLIWQVA